MGPPASCRLDGVLCLARGLRPAWPGGRGLHLELLADRSELLRMEGCAVRRWAGVRRSRPAWRRAPRRCAGTRRPRHSSRADAWLRGRMRMRMWSSTATDRVCAPALPTASHRLSHRAMTGTHDACEVWGVHVQNAAGRVMLVASHERRKRQVDMRPIETSQPVLVAHIESDSWIGF